MGNGALPNGPSYRAHPQLYQAAHVDRAEHVRSARVFQTSTCSAIAKGIIDLDAEVSDGAFDFGVARARAARPAGYRFNDRSAWPLFAATNECQELWVEPNAGDPFRKEPCVLPCRHALSKATSAVEQKAPGFLPAAFK